MAGKTEAEVKCSVDLQTVKQATTLAKQLKANLQVTIQEWTALCKVYNASNKEAKNKKKKKETSLPDVASNNNTIQVSKSDIERLVTEAMQLSEFLPKVVNNEYVGTYSKLEKVQQELQSAQDEIKKLNKELEQLKKRHDVVLNNLEKEKEEKFSCQSDMNNINQQLSTEVEYCTSMGATCCTLLWRVSREETGIQSILTGSKVDEFLQLVSRTIEYYLAEVEDTAQDHIDNSLQFILALCGTVTNIAASAFGREFLMNNEHGRGLIDQFVSCLSHQLQPGNYPRLKNLLLMALYNISINQKGIKHLSSKRGLTRTLTWLLQEENDAEVRLHTVRLLQSLILEPENVEVVHEALEIVSFPALQQIANSSKGVLKEAVLELILDLNSYQNES